MPPTSHGHCARGDGISRTLRRNLVKLLFWDRSGWCILAKRLEVGRFSFPVDIAHDVAQVEVDFATLTMLLEGIDLRGATRRKAFEAPTFVK